ncbi:MAG: hypothetical protein EXS64_17525 [Candidatus Latescibacteria bacterium]|nr:hypothetical protein [Candidatus Latescibacterota bacterium]
MSHRFSKTVLLTFVLTLLASSPALPWGAEGHKLIATKAVEVLPLELRPLFEGRLQDLRRLSVEPDELWKDQKQWDAHPEWKNRSNWHFLDIDHFHFKYPFREFPRTRPGADSLYARADSLYAGRGNAGYLPWTIADFYRALVDAYKKGDPEAIIQNAGLLSHFAGDASMPLHATRNYDGLYSGNIKYKVKSGEPGYPDRSVHERFELALVDLNLGRYGEGIRIVDADRKSLTDILSGAFDFIVESYFQTDRIIAADKVIMERLNVLTEDKKPFDARRDDYYKALDEQVGQLAVDRLKAGAVYLGNLWYSAWLDAGKPALSKK